MLLPISMARSFLICSQYLKKRGVKCSMLLSDQCDKIIFRSVHSILKKHELQMLLPISVTRSFYDVFTILRKRDLKCRISSVWQDHHWKRSQLYKNVNWNAYSNQCDKIILEVFTISNRNMIWNAALPISVTRSSSEAFTGSPVCEL